jgi:hypothetical protein
MYVWSSATDASLVGRAQKEDRARIAELGLCENMIRLPHAAWVAGFGKRSNSG